MARLARIVVPGLPHHITQRGNRREAIFFEDGDQEIYLDLLADQTAKAGVAIWAYCLMPNHVHLVLAPARAEDLGLTIGETHRRYTNFINTRARWTGHLFQRRFNSVVLDDMHVVRAIRYVHANPVRAGLVPRPEDWKWSSIHAHQSRQEDGLVAVPALLKRFPYVEVLLSTSTQEDFADLRRAETTGRPLGTPDFVMGLEKMLGRPIARRATGRKPAVPPNATEQLNLL